MMATVVKKVAGKARAAAPKTKAGNPAAGAAGAAGKAVGAAATASTVAEVNLAGFSTEELRQLARDVAQELKRRQVEDRRTALRAIKELAASEGFTLEELLGTAMTKRRRASAPAEAKYRNPDNPEQTWAGRGRKPGWLVELLLAQGKTLEELGAE
jgi:DNA-binding protein H-NS